MCHIGLQLQEGVIVSDQKNNCTFVILDLFLIFHLQKTLIQTQKKISVRKEQVPCFQVKPGTKEAMAGHKTSNTATGCVGTVAWTLGNTGKMMVVMYSVPFSHDCHKNWLAVGIFTIEGTDDYFNKACHFQNKTKKSSVQ